MDAFITEKGYKLECAKKRNAKGRDLKRTKHGTSGHPLPWSHGQHYVPLDILWDYIHRLLPTREVHPVFEGQSFY